MGRSQAAKAETHDRIVQIASEKLRAEGLAGVSLADLMKEAGLTVGGFYKHFEAREDLLAEAVAAGQQSWQARLAAALEAEAPPPLAAMIDRYLSPAHRDAPATGCLAAALASEIARSGPQTRARFTAGLVESFALLTACLKAAGVPGAEPALRARAITLYSTLIGAIGLARAVDDPALSAEIMDSAAAQIKAQALS